MLVKVAGIGMQGFFFASTGFLQALIEAAGGGGLTGSDLLILDLNNFPRSGNEFVDQALFLRATWGMGPDWGRSRHRDFT